MSAATASSDAEPAMAGWVAAAPAPAMATLALDRRLLTYVMVAVLTLGLGGARFYTGPWYHLYNPQGVVLVEGWPAEWEAIYYVEHFPTFLGDPSPPFGIATVQYRAFVSLYLAAALYAWTGSTYWSMAAIDVLFWFLAGVATYHVALRLSLRERAATYAAALSVASPLFISNMWAHVLHLAEFASMPLGLWAGLVLVEGYAGRSRWRLAAALGAVLLLLSVTYQYQWIVAPLLVVLAAFHPRLGLKPGVAVVASAVGLYAAGTTLLRGTLAAAGLVRDEEQTSAVARPSDLLAERLADMHSFADLWHVLPQWHHVREMVHLYHPVVFGVALVGFTLLPWRTRWLAAMALGASLVAMTLYGAPWTAMSAYPLVYVGAAAACAAGGDAIGRALQAVCSPRTNGAGVPKQWAWLGGAVGLALLFVLASLTNKDLAGDTRFLREWWSYYAGVPLY